MKRRFIIIFLLFSIVFNPSTVLCVALETKYPDYSYEFLGNDNYEKFNRKVFDFNLKLNKYAIRPVHVLWASIMPQYGMDRIQSVTKNIEFPIRLISSLIQRDFQTSKTEIYRFFTNTILGVGGMFDPAKKIFKLEPSNENMEQALAGCKVKSGRYFVLPVLSFSTPRGLLGKLLDTALNPCSYVVSPLLAVIKACLTVNRTTYYQDLIKMVESTFADPYTISKMIFGVDSYVKCANLDRVNILDKLFIPVLDEKNVEEKNETKVEVKKLQMNDIKSSEIVKIEVSSEIANPELLYGGTTKEETLLKNYSAENFKLDADIKLRGFNPQSPVIDSMRTALFNDSSVSKSAWNELSVWNRSFEQRIKTSKINLTEGKPDYCFKYILQKNTSQSPLAIIYPSIGESVNSSHSVILAKYFYDEGYSVIIQGSHFQWEFVKSMPEDYYPGLPAFDAKKIKLATAKIIEYLSLKHNYSFEDKTFIGTSFGAMETLFLGAEEYKSNTFGKSRFIAICPPIELTYAMKQIDKNSEEWASSPEDLKQRVAATSAKVVNLITSKGEIDFEINNLPFSESEAKLITGFLMHQKLSDLIFTLEKASKNVPNTDVYSQINNMNFEDYTKKYILPVNTKMEDFNYETSLHSISFYLENCDNYKIYHSLNDYLTNPIQLKRLKQYSQDKLTLFDNGAHLGFLYRKEFIENLKNTISR